MFESFRTWLSQLSVENILGPEIEIGGYDMRFVIALAVFVGALVTFEGIRQFLKQGENREEAINRRIKMLTEGRSTDDVLNLLKPQETKSFLRSMPFAGDLPAAMKAAGMSMSPEAFLAGCFLAFVFATIAASTLYPLFQAISVCALVFLIVPLALLGDKLKKRKALLLKQLPDALDLMSRGLKVGHPLNTTIQSVANEMPDPIGTEFGIVVDQVAYGDELTTAITNMADRVEEEDVRYLAVAMSLQHGTGGDLAGILRTLARVIRARMALRRKIKAISAEGRLTAYILSSIPFGIIAIMSITTPSFYGSVMHYPMFWPVAGVLLAAIVINAFIMIRLVNFRI